MSIQVIRSAAEMSQHCERLRQSGRRISFVPTMGFLHEGHLSLMVEGGRRADVVVGSIFVNPAQFGPKEDLSTYPRDLEGDLQKCESAGVTAVYAPPPSDVYPPGYQTWVEVEEVSRGLCGDKRPDHFRGVATVVTKLFNIVRPHVALFGEKDYQQLQVIKTLVRDLHLGVEVVGMPTIREPDGLAKSSRNAYLSADERERALSLSRGLMSAQKMVQGGERNPAVLIDVVREQLTVSGVREDYVAIVEAETLRPLDRLVPGVPARMLVAGFLSKTRLIDNVAL